MISFDIDRSDVLGLYAKKIHKLQLYENTRCHVTNMDRRRSIANDIEIENVNFDSIFVARTLDLSVYSFKFALPTLMGFHL